MGQERGWILRLVMPKPSVWVGTNDGDECGADAHVEYFLFCFSSRAAAREQVGEFRSEKGILCWEINEKFTVSRINISEL
jgi:hypothetical protein